LLVSLISLVAACAPSADLAVPDAVYKQRIAYVQRLFDDQERLARIAYDLSTRVTELCEGKTTFTTGAYLFDWDQTSEEWLDVANDAIGINLHTPGIETLIVIPGSPAEKAGLQVGDRILKLDGWPVPNARGAFARFRSRINEQLRSGKTPIEFRIIRDGNFKTISIEPVEACDYPILISDTDGANAYTDGERIVVLRGMVEFASSDVDLAIVISHELSHIILGHVDRQRQQALQGAIVGAVFDVLLAGATGIRTNVGQKVFADLAALSYSKEFETEADYLGTYLMAKAGLDFTRIPEFQRSFGGTQGTLLQYSSSHPTFNARAQAAEQIVEEILTKLRTGQVLEPDLRAWRLRGGR
jgi:Zn-dependent protease with chaperone function